MPLIEVVKLSITLAEITVAVFGVKRTESMLTKRELNVPKAKRVNINAAERYRNAG